MRKNMLAIATAVALALAVPAFAQTDQFQSDQNQQQMGSQGTMVSGTVVSVSDENVVIRTDSGNTLTLSVNDSTDKPTQDLKAGDRIQVWYDQDRVASRIALATGQQMGQQMGQQQMGQQQMGQQQQRDQFAPDRTERDTMAGEQDRDQYGTQNDQFGADRGQLPQTGTNLPLIGLIGLIGLAGGLAVRFFVRS